MLATYNWEHAKNNFPAVSPAKYHVKVKLQPRYLGLWFSHGMVDNNPL